MRTIRPPPTGVYRSGQTGQTVNLMALPSLVRIQPRPVQSEICRARAHAFGEPTRPWAMASLSLDKSTGFRRYAQNPTSFPRNALSADDTSTAVFEKALCKSNGNPHDFAFLMSAQGAGRQ